MSFFSEKEVCRLRIVSVCGLTLGGSSTKVRSGYLVGHKMTGPSLQNWDMMLGEIRQAENQENFHTFIFDICTSSEK